MILTLIPGNNKARVRAEKLVQRVYRPKKKMRERDNCFNRENRKNILKKNRERKLRAIMRLEIIVIIRNSRRSRRRIQLILILLRHVI